MKQDFTADEVNKKWCTDFTYLFLADHEVRYNCTIIDLHDRSVIASITDRHIITAEVAQVAWMNRKQIKELFEANMFVETLEYFFTEVDKQ